MARVTPAALFVCRAHPLLQARFLAPQLQSVTVGIWLTFTPTTKTLVWKVGDVSRSYTNAEGKVGLENPLKIHIQDGTRS